MAALVPAIHVFIIIDRKIVDARVKPGHDSEGDRRPSGNYGPADQGSD
jgi:hypothetical protein